MNTTAVPMDYMQQVVWPSYLKNNSRTIYLQCIIWLILDILNIPNVLFLNGEDRIEDVFKRALTFVKELVIDMEFQATMKELLHNTMQDG
jgi:hypothetical protein